MNNKDFKKRLLGSLIAGLMLSPPILADEKGGTRNQLYALPKSAK